jgi:hypothetical protein
MLQRYFSSMAGRLFLFLLVGVMGSASLALGMADVRRQADLRRIQLERLSDRVQDFISLANSAPAPLRGELISRGMSGLRPASGEEKIEKADTALTLRLNSRLGADIRADYAVPSSCFPRGADRRSYTTLDCRMISAILADGSAIKVVMVTPQAHNFGLPGLDPVFLSVLAIGVGCLTFFAARSAVISIACRCSSAVPTRCVMPCVHSTPCRPDCASTSSSAPTSWPRSHMTFRHRSPACA